MRHITVNLVVWMADCLPDHQESDFEFFRKRDALPYPAPPAGTQIHLSSEYVKSLTGEISDRFDLDFETGEMDVRVLIPPENFDIAYFNNPKNGWVGSN